MASTAEIPLFEALPPKPAVLVVHTGDVVLCSDVSSTMPHPEFDLLIAEGLDYVGQNNRCMIMKSLTHPGTTEYWPHHGQLPGSETRWTGILTPSFSRTTFDDGSFCESDTEIIGRITP